MTFLEALAKFAQDTGFVQRTGAICVGLQITRQVQSDHFPLDPKDYLTPRGGQVRGLSGPNVKNLLEQHGEYRVFSKEGGRTNRGAMDDMEAYVRFLNNNHNAVDFDLTAAEEFWANQATQFLDRDPFKLKLDAALSTQAVISDLMAQAFERQKTGGGTHHAGALMQHLVGAKLECIDGIEALEHNSFTTSDDQQGRAGDFDINDTIVHVTTSPGPALIEKCKSNLQRSLLPMIITTADSVGFAQDLAGREGVKDRIEFIQIEQFVATNVLEKSLFDHSVRKVALTDIIDRYNQLIDQYETQKSLKIDYE